VGFGWSVYGQGTWSAVVVRCRQKFAVVVGVFDTDCGSLMLNEDWRGLLKLLVSICNVGHQLKKGELARRFFLIRQFVSGQVYLLP